MLDNPSHLVLFLRWIFTIKLQSCRKFTNLPQNFDVFGSQIYFGEGPPISHPVLKFRSPSNTVKIWWWSTERPRRLGAEKKKSTTSVKQKSLHHSAADLLNNVMSYTTYNHSGKPECIEKLSMQQQCWLVETMSNWVSVRHAPLNIFPSAAFSRCRSSPLDKVSKRRHSPVSE